MSLFSKSEKIPEKRNLEGALTRESQESVFDGFLLLLREKGVRVSTPEWLQFLRVCEHKFGSVELEAIVANNTLLTEVRLFGEITLVKDKADEASFHRAFDEYFVAPVTTGEEEVDTDPEIKEQLDTQEVVEEVDASEENQSEEEEVHGGEEDQHNDILQKKDDSKQGGGGQEDDEASGKEDKGDISSDGESEEDSNISEKSGEGVGEGDTDPGKGSEEDTDSGKGNKGDSSASGGDKENAGIGKGDKGEAGAGEGAEGDPSGEGKEAPGEGREVNNITDDTSNDPEAASNVQQNMSEEGVLVGGGKGKSALAERTSTGGDILHSGKKMTHRDVERRESQAQRHDRKLRYEVRPGRESIRQVIRKLRRIITDVSEVKGRKVDIAGTVKKFAKKKLRFSYLREREKQPEIVLLIDVGGPVDEWSPLMKEVTEEMAKGLSKLEVYLFHNNIYGYVWESGTNYAKPDSIIDIKKVIKSRKKVIIYGDAEMSYSEFEHDEWPPEGNEERVQRFGMNGSKSLKFIKRKAESVVWVNPVFSKEWEERDDSGTITSIGDIIPMHDLTVGGVEDAVRTLMKR